MLGSGGVSSYGSVPDPEPARHQLESGDLGTLLAQPLPSWETLGDDGTNLCLSFLVQEMTTLVLEFYSETLYYLRVLSLAEFVCGPQRRNQQPDNIQGPWVWFQRPPLACPS